MAVTTRHKETERRKKFKLRTIFQMMRVHRKSQLLYLAMMPLATAWLGLRVHAFAAASVGITEHFISNKETRIIAKTVDDNNDGFVSATSGAPYHGVLEFADTIQDFRDIFSDYKAIARSQSILIDTTNQFVVASHLADILVDIFNRIFQKNVSCKLAQVIVRTCSLATMQATDPTLDHPEQLVLQGVLLVVAANDLIGALRASGSAQGERMESSFAAFPCSINQDRFVS